MLIRMSVSSSGIKGGERLLRKRLITSDGCNEPFHGGFLCPRRSWISRECCPFCSKHECELFRRQCGGIL